MSIRIHTATAAYTRAVLLVEGGVSVGEFFDDDEITDTDVPLPALVFIDDGNLEAFVITIGSDPTGIRTAVQQLAEILYPAVNDLVVANDGGLDDLFGAG